MADAGTATTSRSSQPSIYKMLMEALKECDDKKGATLQYIRGYIEKHYPEARTDKMRIKKAISKGFDEQTIVRPKNSETKGITMTGRFKYNKEKATEEIKLLKAKQKAAKKTAAEKIKSTAEAAKVTAASKKAPRSKSPPNKAPKSPPNKAPKSLAKKAPKSKSPTKKKTAKAALTSPALERKNKAVKAKVALAKAKATAVNMTTPTPKRTTKKKLGPIKTPQTSSAKASKKLKQPKAKATPSAAKKVSKKAAK